MLPLNFSAGRCFFTINTQREAPKTLLIFKLDYLEAVLKILPGSEFIKLVSCSTQVSMKFVLLINLKLLTTANSFLLNMAEHD